MALRSFGPKVRSTVWRRSTDIPSATSVEGKVTGGAIRQDYPPPSCSELPLRKRSPFRITCFDVDVKTWVRQAPSVAAVRPAMCISCQAPAAPLGGPLGLHGHGLRERRLLGPAAAGERPGVHILHLRRYRCRHCGAVMVSAPRGLLPRLRYGAVAVAMALALWSSEREPGWQVRSRVSPVSSLGNEPAHGWRSLRRWARNGRHWWARDRDFVDLSPRSVAFQITCRIAAKAPVPTGRLWLDACAGVLWA
jgi:hypothetical protein